MMTTIDNVTREQIEQLRTEAAEAGDRAQVALCDEALRRWNDRGYVGEDIDAALRKCVRAIQSAEAMAAE